MYSSISLWILKARSNRLLLFSTDEKIFLTVYTAKNSVFFILLTIQGITRRFLYGNNNDNNNKCHDKFVEKLICGRKSRNVRSKLYTTDFEIKTLLI